MKAEHIEIKKRVEQRVKKMKASLRIDTNGVHYDIEALAPVGHIWKSTGEHTSLAQSQLSGWGKSTPWTDTAKTLDAGTKPCEYENCCYCAVPWGQLLDTLCHPKT